MLDDGARPYPKAIDCLVQLRAAVKRTAINRARRAEIGIDDSLYDAIVTSGEATWQAFAERPEPFFAALGGRCFLWSRCGDRSVVDGLPLEAVERVENAEFVLLGGVEDAPGWRTSARTWRPRPIAARPGGAPIRTPSRCSPTVASAWARAPSPTVTSSSAGPCATVGKPHRPICQSCLEALGNPPQWRGS